MTPPAGSPSGRGHGTPARPAPAGPATTPGPRPRKRPRSPARTPPAQSATSCPCRFGSYHFLPRWRGGTGRARPAPARTATAADRYDAPAATLASAPATARTENPYSLGAGWPSHGSSSVAHSRQVPSPPPASHGSTSVNRCRPPPAATHHHRWRRCPARPYQPARTLTGPTCAGSGQAGPSTWSPYVISTQSDTIHSYDKLCSVPWAAARFIALSIASPKSVIRNRRPPPYVLRARARS